MDFFFLDSVIPGNRIIPISTEQVLTGGDSGFSEIEMTPSTEEYSENAGLPSFENELQSPVPGSSNFDSRYSFIM